MKILFGGIYFFAILIITTMSGKHTAWYFSYDWMLLESGRVKNKRKVVPVSVLGCWSRKFFVVSYQCRQK